MEYGQQYQQIPERKYECLLFDVDDTLYPLSCGLSGQTALNIRDYMVTKLGIEEEKVPELNAQLYNGYGTTMAGLLAIGYDLDYDDYHSYVHGRLPYDDILKPDPVLKYLLQSLPIRKVIFSNANKEHVDQVLGRLGLKECFDQVICFETLNPINKRNRIGEEDESNPSTILGTNTNFVNESSEHNTVLPKPLVACKPSEVSFELALKTAQINPKKTLFFDDSIRNLQTGKLMGLQTVWVGSSHRTKGVDHALKSIHNMKEALPDLWEAIEKTEDVHYTEQVAIQTSVRA